MMYMYFMKKYIALMVKNMGKGGREPKRMITEELHIRNYRYCGDKEWEKGVVFMGSNNDRRSVRK